MSQCLTASKITPEIYAQQSGKQSEVQICGSSYSYLESRPHEQGRNALVICEEGKAPQDLLAAPASIRTRAQEYGGGSYLLSQQYIFYVLDSDQNIYAYDRTAKTHAVLTQVNAANNIQYRFADFCWDEKRQQLIVVCEDFTRTNLDSSEQHPKSCLARLKLKLNEKIEVLIQGADFYSNPRLSPNASQLSFLCWNHPDMPWDSTQCFCVELDDAGKILKSKKIAGGDNESIFQPQWSPSGELFLVSDRNNWWNIYQYRQGQLEIVCELPAEFATPQWVFGMSTYAFLDANTIICCYTQAGLWQLGIINLKNQQLIPLKARSTELDFRDISGLCAQNDTAYFFAGSAFQSQSLWIYSNHLLTPINSKSPLLNPDEVSVSQTIEFPTLDGEVAHAFFYAPANIVSNNLPPLIVMCHGGPTGATESSFAVKIQFWTSRGFAVVDVNYRGSTGFGRKYRDRLKNNWGLTDVIDVCSAANYLVEQKIVDKNRVVIRGSSAGGFSVLAALSFSHQYFPTQIFCAGASLYGIGDLEALARDTHKFEAHYLDQLVGKYPEDISIYHARSPLYHLENFNCPVIFFQGLKDKVVPPAQAEAMVEALNKKSIRAEYICFEDEGHGFRNARNVQVAIEKELEFYLSVFGATSRIQSN